MAEDDRPQDQPSLELPSFSLRRRRRDRTKPVEDSPPEPVGEPVAAPVAEPIEEPVAGPIQEPVVGPVAGRVPGRVPGRLAGRVARRRAAEPPTGVAPAPSEPVESAVERPEATDTRPPAPAAEEPAAPAPAPAPTRAAVREPDERPVVVLPKHHEPDATAGDEPDTVRARRVRRVRRPAGLPAATLTGLVAGLGLVGLTWASLRSCGAVRGTTSCGGAVGYPLVALIFVVMVVVAAVLLRMARVPEPTGTSLLGLGLTGVVALLFLADVLLSGSMVVVIPLVTAGTFALSHWVTRSVGSPARD